MEELWLPTGITIECKSFSSKISLNIISKEKHNNRLSKDPLEDLARIASTKEHKWSRKCKNAHHS